MVWFKKPNLLLTKVKKYLVGLVSYLLVNFWFTRIDANHASLKAFLMNRIGDWGLTLGILFWYIVLGDITINLYISNIHPDLIYIIGLLLFLGAIAKSAQIGLHSWLTSAMEGKRKFIAKQYRNLVTSRNKIYPDITPYQKEAIIGLLLSDGYISKLTNSIEFTFKADALEFCLWLKFDILGTLSSKTLPTPYPKQNPKQYWFSTLSHPYFKELRIDWYYPKKFVPKDLIKHFTEVSLAFCLMGDGYWEKDSKTIFICTECFTLEEVHIILDILRNKLGLKATLKKRNNGFRIRFSSRGKNLERIRSLVLPHFHSSMLYKLGI